MTKREIVENASGAAMECEESAKCPRQVDVTRSRLATRRFAVVANKIDGGGRQRRRPWAPVRRCTATHNNIDIVR
jgi:hypothetical protein